MSNNSTETLTLEDVEVAIEKLRNRLRSMSQNDPDFRSTVILLALGLRKHYLLLRPHGDLGDLEQSITLLQQIVDSSSINDPQRAECLINLALCLNLRCNATESESDAMEASRLASDAVDAVEKDDPSFATILQSASHVICKTAVRLHDEDDLEKSFEMHKRLLDITPFNHPKLISRLRSYEDTLFKGYLGFGDKKALEESIRVLENIVNIPSQNSEDHARHLWILGQRLVQRYLRTGMSEDLDGSIKACQEAVNQTGIGSKNRQRRLQSLCDRLGEKYSETLDEADFQAAKIVMDNILYDLPSNTKSRARSLGNIGIILSLRYRQTGREDDLQRALNIAKESIDLTADGDMGLPLRLSNLGGLLLQAYSNSGSIESLEESIRIGRESLIATPNGHPDSALRSFNLADRLRIRYLEYGSAEDLQDAISSYQHTLDHCSAPTFLRVQAGLSLMQSYISSHDLAKAYGAGSKAIDILSLFKSRSLRNLDIQREASKLSGLATETASVALHSGKSVVLALEALEMARGVMASSISVLRADIKELEKDLPELAQRYKRLRDQLDDDSSHNPNLDLGGEILGSAISQRYNVGEQLSALLEEIRSRPGFEFFLRPDDEEVMRRAASQGPVIVVNVGSLVCDAIIIQESGFSAVPLPKLSKSDIESKHRSLGRGSLQVLEWLWDAVAEPILDHLGFTEPLYQAEMKRVWWVLTGPLSSFPIHAAGRHTESNGKAVIDRVMSSYATSVSAIGQIRKTAHGTTNEALLVSAGETPGQERLTFADREIGLLRDVCRRMRLQPVEPEPIKKDVLSHLRECKIFHFAGHGSTDTADPSRSQIYLRDWETNPLTVASLLELNLHRDGPFLAYLSACGTGQIKSQELFDEGIHLISACQLAGFRHVIGTLWEVNDQSCVDIAAIIYEEILKGDLSDESVCRGVHFATKLKRDQWLDETYGADNHSSENWSERQMGQRYAGRDIISLNEQDEQGIPGMGNGQLHWVPYVHFGA